MMSDWQKPNFPPPRARLPLDADEWSSLDCDAWNTRGSRDTDGPTIARDARRRSRAAEGPGARTRSDRPSRPVPRMPKTKPDTKVRSPGITLAGTLLIVGLTVLAFAGGRLFGRVEEPALGTQVETAAQTIPAPQVAPPPPKLEPVVETEVGLPASFARPPIVCLDPGHGGEDRGFSRFFEDR